MPLEVWDALTAHVANAASQVRDLRPTQLDDNQANAMGEFWLAIASGRPAAPP